MKKILFSMLALLLAMGGAWAQGPTQVTQFTTDMIADWQGVNEAVTLADLQAIGFVATDLATAQAWTGAPQSGSCYLYYAISGSEIAFVYFTSGSANDYDQSQVVKADLYDDISQGYKFFYTGAPSPEPAEIKLTKTGDNQWTLAETPDYDLDLQVVYYQKYALKEIPANWQVKVDGVDKTAAIDHDSLMITETAQVLLTPDHPERVKKVTLVDEAVLVNIDGITLDITGCTYWSDIIARNSGVIRDDGGYILSNRGVLVLAGSVFTDHPYDPAQQSNYHWQQ